MLPLLSAAGKDSFTKLGFVFDNDIAIVVLPITPDDRMIPDNEVAETPCVSPHRRKY
jgi:hypothetical protein